MGGATCRYVYSLFDAITAVFPKVKLCAENYVEKFGKDKVVFLAAESPNVLQTLDPSKAYIIGGLVDHNHHKVSLTIHQVEVACVIAKCICGKAHIYHKS